MIEYFIIINVIEFILMGLDKFFSIKKIYRIPEIVLLVIPFLGGSIGGIIGMVLFRHKTKKIKFKILFIMSLIVNILYIVID